MANEEVEDYGDLSCHYQDFGDGGLVCNAANMNSKSTTYRTTRTICANCDVGKIYREVGCDQFNAQTNHLPVAGGIHQMKPKIFCKRKVRETTIEQCRSCTLANAETMTEITKATFGLLHSEGFESALDDFEKARKALRESEFDGVIRSSISMLESAMKIAQGRLTGTIEGKNVTDLWKFTSKVLKINELGNSNVSKIGAHLSGVIEPLGGLRNSLSDAHGDGDDTPEVPAMLAEFVFMTSCCLVTLIIRRYIQLKREMN
jgi:hypothetical protein